MAGVKLTLQVRLLQLLPGEHPVVMDFVANHYKSFGTSVFSTTKQNQGIRIY